MIKLEDIVNEWFEKNKLFMPMLLIKKAIERGVEARERGMSGWFEALFAINEFTGIKPPIELSNLFRELDE